MSMVVAGIITTVIGVGVNIGLSIKAQNDADDAEFRKTQEQRFQEALERNRQDIPNPYENIQDLSHMIRNPYANLSVATGAAEMQAEQADISLANVLDTLRASGSSAGGATALAQAALRSKKGISADIQRQEAQNARLRAQGEASMQQLRMAEKQRLQNAGVQGSLFTYGEQDKREMQQLDRSQNRINQEALNQQANQAAAYNALGNAGSALIGVGGDMAVAGMKSGSSGGKKSGVQDGDNSSFAVSDEKYFDIDTSLDKETEYDEMIERYSYGYGGKKGG